VNIQFFMSDPVTAVRVVDKTMPMLK